MYKGEQKGKKSGIGFDLGGGGGSIWKTGVRWGMCMRREEG